MNVKIATRKTAKGGTAISVSLGNVAVDIYCRTKTNRERTYDYFEVADFSAGVRRLRPFYDRDKAVAEAERIVKLLNKGDAVAAQMTGRDATACALAAEHVKPTGVPLELAAAHFAEAFKILGGDRIVEAAKDFARRNPASREPRTVAEVAAEMVEMKRKRGKGDRYIEDLNGRLGKFANAFKVDISTITGPDVQSWLDKMDAAPRTVKNCRSNVSQLFKFAESRGYITRGENPVSQTEKIKAKTDEAVEIYTPAEVERLLAAAPKWFKPILALQAFAGLRSAEVARLEWQDIDLAKGYITVAAHKAKTASRRLVPIQPNLGAWLADFANRKGPIYKHGRAYFHETQREVAAATKIEADKKSQVSAVAPVAWKHNALRHSFISYRLAETQDAAKVALEAGNSPAMIFAHYRELVTPEDAKAWFAVSPTLPANVTPMPKPQAAEKARAAK